MAPHRDEEEQQPRGETNTYHPFYNPVIHPRTVEVYAYVFIHRRLPRCISNKPRSISLLLRGLGLHSQWLPRVEGKSYLKFLE